MAETKGLVKAKKITVEFDGSNSVEITVDSNGDLTITPSGGDATIATANIKRVKRAADIFNVDNFS